MPNRCVGRNKRTGGKILKKTLNVQDVINVQGEMFLLTPLKKCVVIPLNKKKMVYFEKNCTFMTI